MGYWFNETGNEGDIAVSTRVRLARNINGYPFPSIMTDSMREEINQKVKNAIIGSNTPFARSLRYIAMKDIPENERYAMVERHIISPEFVSNCENKAIIISEDESISVMIGEEDHIRIQVILSGLQLENAYDIAERLDTLLCDCLDIAFDENLGFLTECPTNLGTGLRASLMLHLPVLESTGEIKNLSRAVEKIGFTVRGMYGEGSSAIASFYQISNQITLGISEKNAIDNLKTIAMQFIEKERAFRGTLNHIKTEDLCYRALGTLKNARILSSEEMIKLLSRVKLGISMNIIDEKINPVKSLIEGQPYMLMSKFGDMSPDERDIKRATLIREIFSI